jgi:hypothetical protein
VVFVGGPRYHQAWFPLGWHEPYYPRYRHSDRYLREVNIANVRNISNVDEFIDVRRADRIDYTNRQATTVVPSDIFGRRPVTHVASVTPEEISRAPIVRDRWDSPRLANPATSPQTTTADRPTPFLRRRDASTPPPVSEPTRVTEATRPEASEPRRNSPLIYRNSPVARRPADPEIRSPVRDTPPRQASEPQPIDRGHTMIRRNEPPQSPDRGEPADRVRRSILQRVDPAAVERTAPRASSPRESSPREPSARESSPRTSSPPSAEPRVRTPTSIGSGGAQRVPSRRPPV